MPSGHVERFRNTEHEIGREILSFAHWKIEREIRKNFSEELFFFSYEIYASRQTMMYFGGRFFLIA